VAGDRDELIRVFENLVENALKYGASGKRVEVTLAHRRDPGRQRPARRRSSVRDFGPGIAAEHLPRLTERFYRVDVGESRAQGGTGLGLALVKHILNRHRGRLARPDPHRRLVDRVPVHPGGGRRVRQRRPASPSPVVESTGTGGGMKIFCQGIGPTMPTSPAPRAP
jgi:hypothetical protein